MIQSSNKQLHRTSTRKGGFAPKVLLRLDALRKYGWPGERGVRCCSKEQL